MTLMIEDGNGRPDATSYVTLAEASAYLAARGRDSDWIDLSETEQGALLVRAMDYLAGYRARWKGYRVNTEQALDWPRQSVVLHDLPTIALVPYNSIPREVKAAQIELASRAMTVDLAPDLERGVISESVGTLSVTYDRWSPQQSRYRAVDALLAPLLQSMGIMVPVGRA